MSVINQNLSSYVQCIIGLELFEKSSPRAPLRNFLMIFGTWELHSQAPKMVKSFKGVQEKIFLEKSNLTMHQTYDDNSDLPHYPCIAVGDILLGKVFLILSF